jgi:hypothetical protein
VSLNHQLIDSLQLRVIVRAHLARLNIRHRNRSCVLIVLRSLRDEYAQRFELSIFDCIEHSDAIRPGTGK